MAIEVVSWPKDLRTWDEKEQRYYFELSGETRPQVDPRLAELLGGADSKEAVPVYVYSWTIGHGGFRQKPRRPLDRLRPPDGFWNNLQDDPYAARVYVYFPVDCGWRVSELAATVNYMTPVDHQASFAERAAKDWQTLQPLVDDAAKLATSLVPAGAAVSGSARMLGALAQMKINSVPQVGEFQWAAGKVTFGHPGRGVMAGVEWALPKSMFRELGGRLTGSLAVRFAPMRQQADVVGPEEPDLRRGHVLAHAVVHGPEGTPDWAPGPSMFIELIVEPRSA
jgi:hypothetical protein